MNISVAGYTHVGGRDNNEDSYGIFDRELGKLCVVADGLGGHAYGEVASRAALETVEKNIYGTLSDERMLDAANKANEEVLRISQAERMNTTLAALWLQDGQGLTASVGDTRIYQFRDGRIIYQSRDHSLAHLNALSGDSYFDDVRSDPDRNRLIRVVGMKEGFKVDISPISYRVGDAFLLCSDGFWEDVLEPEMIRALQDMSNAQQWLDAMCGILKPRLHSNSDNNTAIAVMIV